ncbi:MAG TPA: MFS transporter [Candidatus Limnocylindria bacterium]|nr:MFS transporter [Candidatus Limnocylindria bacterium]
MRSVTLSRDRDFLVFWAGRAVSDLGDQITLVALPLTAIATLQATPAQVGILTALSLLPGLVLSLHAGVWIDRVRRRPVLIGCAIASAVLLSWIPVAYLLGVLAIEQLYIVAFATGTLTVLSLVARQSYLPSVVGRDRLVEANGRLLSTQSMAEVAGPGISGILVQILTAPLPIVLDALSFVVSAATLGIIRRPEPPARATRRPVLAEIREGFAALFGHPVLRALVLSAALLLVAAGAQNAVFILFMARELSLEPAAIGVILAARSIGAVVGSISAGPVAQRFGLGPSILAAVLFAGITFVGRGLAGGPTAFAVLTLVGVQIWGGITYAIYSVNGPSLRQALTPDHLLGRVNATYRFAAWGVAPIGALAGGLIAQAFDARTALLAAGAWTIVPIAYVALSPLRSVRQVSAPAVG